MAYEKPSFSLNQVDKAGKVLTSRAGHGLGTPLSGSFSVLLNHRASHSYPLNALHMTLRNRARSIDPTASTAQRLKRLESILRKLRRNPSMQLSQMQDVGGCRAIVDTIDSLHSLIDQYDRHPLKHEVSHSKNYIVRPKEDGYRGIHLMYRYRGRASSSPWDRLRIEIQLRTRLQHAWATAVETVDAFTGELLKFGGGREDWRRFFLLASASHAYLEGTPLPPNVPSDLLTIRDELRVVTKSLDVVRKLRSFSHVTSYFQGADEGEDLWYVLELRPEDAQVVVTTYVRGDFAEARQLVATREREFEDTPNQVVLVSASSISELRKAYPNYFADTQFFLRHLEKFIAPASGLRRASSTAML